MQIGWLLLIIASVSALSDKSMTNNQKSLRTQMLKKIPFCNDNARLWIRAAFHDAGTFDKSTKEGGLDGSLLFELDRKENGGLRRALNDFNAFKARHNVELADVLALGGALAFEACTGRKIKFEFGRATATSANLEDRLPNPDDSLRRINTIFIKRLGFTKRETVALIGGGHSTARVHENITPNVMPGQFDGTINRCDTQYFMRLAKGEDLMLADSKLNDDPEMSVFVKQFAQDEDEMLDAYTKAFTKLLNMGFQ